MIPLNKKNIITYIIEQAKDFNWGPSKSVHFHDQRIKNENNSANRDKKREHQRDKNISDAIPKFGHGDWCAALEDWIFKVNMAVGNFNIEDTELMRFLTPKLEGVPLQIFKRMISNDPNVGWDELKTELMSELGEDDERKLLMSLKSLTLNAVNNNFTKYLEKFHLIIK